MFVVLLPLLRRPGGSLSASKFLTNGVRKIMYTAESVRGRGGSAGWLVFLLSRVSRLMILTYSSFCLTACCLILVERGLVRQVSSQQRRERE